MNEKGEFFPQRQEARPRGIEVGLGEVETKSVNVQLSLITPDGEPVAWLARAPGMAQAPLCEFRLRARFSQEGALAEQEALCLCVAPEFGAEARRSVAAARSQSWPGHSSNDQVWAQSGRKTSGKVNSLGEASAMIARAPLVPGQSPRMQHRTVMVPVQMVLRSPSPPHGRQMLAGPPAGGSPASYGCMQGLSFHPPPVDRRGDPAARLRPAHCAAWAHDHPRRRMDDVEELAESAKATPRLVPRVLPQDLQAQPAARHLPVHAFVRCP